MRANITFYFETNCLKFTDVLFKGCSNINETRTWFNETKNFINIQDTIINLTTVIYIRIEECKNETNN